MNKIQSSLSCPDAIFPESNAASVGLGKARPRSKLSRHSCNIKKLIPCSFCDCVEMPDFLKLLRLGGVFNSKSSMLIKLQLEFNFPNQKKRLELSLFNPSRKLVRDALS